MLDSNYFIEPDDSTVVRRYLTLEELLSILGSNKLFFRNTKSFKSSDTHETELTQITKLLYCHRFFRPLSKPRL